ncbi:unnamed protein product [Rodentolepis nana]|uniref:MOB kinase activator-like 1 n=1 Tax=Rodentolepis nana TaxID=102285 RepID=A0A0R3TCX1_RODNA|nr:unnamed protein product [Rodentolepis nana]
MAVLYGGGWGVPFPPNFLKIAKEILKRLFRVYAHIYNLHFREVQLLDEATHLNTSFKHFVYFVLLSLQFTHSMVHIPSSKSSVACSVPKEFDLVPPIELEALQLVIDALTAPKPERPHASGSSHHQSSGGGKNQPPNGVIQSEPLPPSPSSANRN